MASERNMAKKRPRREGLQRMLLFQGYNALGVQRSSLKKSEKKNLTTSGAGYLCAALGIDIVLNRGGSAR